MRTIVHVNKQNELREGRNQDEPGYTTLIGMEEKIKDARINNIIKEQMKNIGK